MEEERKILKINVGEIRRSPFNHRIIREDDRSIQELAANIVGNGLISPITIRPVPHEAGGASYEIVCGERRWVAHRVAGLEEIDCLVRELSDDEARLICCEENLHREDLHPVVQGAQIQDLLDLGWSAKDVAEKLGLRSTDWVLRRAHLTALTQTWQELVQDPEEMVSRWPIRNLELMSRLSAAIQDEQANKWRRKSEWEGDDWWDKHVAGMRAQELARTLADYVHVIDAAPWKKDIEGLGECRACEGCQSRSDAQCELFSEEELQACEGEFPDLCRSTKKRRPAMCLDVECWDRKTAAFLAQRIEELRGKHGEIILAKDGECGIPDAVSSYTIQRVNKKEPGAQVCLHVNGPEAGQTFFGKPRKNEGSGPRDSGFKKKEKTIEEKCQAWDRKVLEKAATNLSTLIEQRMPLDMPWQGPASIEPLVRLALTVGIKRKFDRFEEMGKRADLRIGPSVYETEPTRLQRDLFDAVKAAVSSEIDECLRAFPHDNDIEMVCDWAATAMNLSWAAVLNETKTGRPYPKSWGISKSATKSAKDTKETKDAGGTVWTDEKGMEYLVWPMLEGSGFSVCKRKPGAAGAHRVKSALCKIHKTRQAAENDLDLYARTKRLEKATG